MNVQKLIEKPDYASLEFDVGSQLETAVDWLTVTTAKESVGLQWTDRYMQYRDGLPGDNPHLVQKTWKTLGYEGVGVPGIRIGKSKDLGFIAVLSGQVSNELWKFFLPGARRVTRVDLAVTARFGIALPGLSKRYYEYVQECTEARPAQKYTLIENTKGGQTLYVGSRSSQQYGRVYDKGVEAKSAPPGFCWRYEVEYKKPLAQEITRVLKSVGQQESKAIVGTVHRWFASRSVPPMFRPEGDSIGTTVEAKVITDDRKVNWLRSQVAPTVAYLIARGRGHDALYALGLMTQEEFDKFAQIHETM